MIKILSAFLIVSFSNQALAVKGTLLLWDRPWDEEQAKTIQYPDPTKLKFSEALREWNLFGKRYEEAERLKSLNVITRSEINMWMLENYTQKQLDPDCHTVMDNARVVAFTPHNELLHVYDIQSGTLQQFKLSHLKKSDVVSELKSFPDSNNVFMVVKHEDTNTSSLYMIDLATTQVPQKLYTTVDPFSALSLGNLCLPTAQKGFDFYLRNFLFCESMRGPSNRAVQSRFLRLNLQEEATPSVVFKFNTQFLDFIFDEEMNPQYVIELFESSFCMSKIRHPHQMLVRILHFQLSDYINTSHFKYFKSSDIFPSFLFVKDSRETDKAIPCRVDLSQRGNLQELLTEEEIETLEGDVKSILVDPQNPKELLAYSVRFGRVTWYGKKGLERGEIVANILNQSQTETGFDFFHAQNSMNENHVLLRGTHAYGRVCYAVLSLENELPQIQFIDFFPELSVITHLQPRIPQVESFIFQARDGLQIQGLMTRPVTPLPHNPGILLIHGGPRIFDKWEFGDDRFFLASRGYTVLQVNFRGSPGRGNYFDMMSRGGWGGPMIDDLEDAVKWASVNDYVNPEYIGAVGASYGGHASMSLAAFKPNFLKCAVPVMGNYHIPQAFEEAALPDANLSPDLEFTLFHLDPTDDMDIEKLNSMSPFHQADQVKVPVVLIHGEQDTNCRPAQSIAMYNELRKHSKETALVLLKNEGHSYGPDYQEQIQVIFEHVFAKYLGGRAESVGNTFLDRWDIKIKDPRRILPPEITEGSICEDLPEVHEKVWPDTVPDTVPS